MELNLDFLAIISQLTLNLVLIFGLAIYLVYTYSWESNTKQEEEAETQFNEMRANLARNKAANNDNSVQESLLPRGDQSSL